MPRLPCPRVRFAQSVASRASASIAAPQRRWLRHSLFVLPVDSDPTQSLCYIDRLVVDIPPSRPTRTVRSQWLRLPSWRQRPPLSAPQAASFSPPTFAANRRPPLSSRCDSDRVLSIALRQRQWTRQRAARLRYRANRPRHSVSASIPIVGG